MRPQDVNCPDQTNQRERSNKTRERISTLLDCIAEQQDRKLEGSLTPVDKQKPCHVMLAFLYSKLYVLMTDYICLRLP